MVKINIINEESVTKTAIQSIKNTLESVFKYTDTVNVHVFLNFKSPVDTLGIYNYLFFIEVPFLKGKKNYFRTSNNVFLNNLVFAIRKVVDPTVINVKDGKMYTKTGELDYHEQNNNETAALQKFIKDNIPEVRYVKLALCYLLKAPNCSVKYCDRYLICNTPLNLYQLISKIVDSLKGDLNRKYFLVMKKKIGLSDFIQKFINITKTHTNHGILTKKKMDAISTKIIGKQMQTLYDVAGKKLGIVTGKAGTGKSLALLTFMYKHVQHGHHCRLLTFNNLLVMDIKMALRNMGHYIPTNTSISTLHKFFYEIYTHTPVCLLHMNDSQFEHLFAVCHQRIKKMVVLIEIYVSEKGFTKDINNILNYYIEKNVIKKEEQKEMSFFIYYLMKCEDWKMEQLHTLAINYENEKRMRFIANYGQNAFLSSYRIILEQLYLLFHNFDSFFDKFGIDLSANLMSVHQTEEFKEKYAIQYDNFIEQCKKSFSYEHGIPKELFTQFMSDEKELCYKIIDKNKEKNVIEQIKKNQDTIKNIKRKIKWSNFVFVDEAQDCTNYEKELLLELYGSANIIVASGGKDQLIRTAIETHWDKSFGIPFNHEKIKLTYVSHRQKGNIIEFVNVFAKEFGLNTELSVPDTLKNTGKVIIDMRKCITAQSLPLDVINNMKLSGNNYGCTPYESMMMLFPSEGFTKVNCIANSSPIIDTNDTISFDGKDIVRSLAIPQIDGINILDCTVSSKSHLLKDVGHDKTRCLLYESCRGLEAWSVLCMALDSFFLEKLSSSAAADYADEALGLFKDDILQKNILCEKYAAIQVLLALTRAMNTLYISFTSLNSLFTLRILQIASRLPFVEILR